MMMADPRISRLARTLVRYSVGVQTGDLVNLWCIGSLQAGMPMLVELYRETLDAGGNPHVMVPPSYVEEFGYLAYQHSSDEQLEYIDPSTDYLVRQVDCDIAFYCRANSRYLSNVDPAKRTIHRKAAAYLTELFEERAAAGELRWTLSNFPTSGGAQDAEMSLEEYQDFVYAATFADRPNGVENWAEFRRRQESMVGWLAGKEHVQIEGPGVDLVLSIKDRPFISCHGDKNMPDGEIFTGPVENSVSGRVKFSFPCVWGGVEVIGVELTFDDGKVVEAHADKNEAFLLETLATDDGSSYLGEFGIGTNDRIDRFTKNMLFDEKMGGTIHLALGLGYLESGSKNKSAIHWDLLTDMKGGGKIVVDGELLYESGAFKVL
jgi:aminopeptidase